MQFNRTGQEFALRTAQKWEKLYNTGSPLQDRRSSGKWTSVVRSNPIPIHSIVQPE